MPEALLNFTLDADRPGWPQRAEAAAAVLEALFPGDPLCIGYGLGDSDPETPLADRPAWLARSIAAQGRFALRGQRVRPLFAGATHAADHRFLTLGAGPVAGSPACMVAAAGIVFDDPAVVEAALVAVGDALEAESAHWSPPPLEMWRRVLQTGARDVHGLARQTPPGVTLPRIDPLAPRDPLRPSAAGWWNYWSQRTCEFLGVPDPDAEPQLRELARRTPGGAWLVKLDAAVPADLTAPAMERLAWLYARLPRLATG